MSARELPDQERRDRPAHAVAGYLAAAALFAGLAGIVYKPGQVGPGAIFVALLAAALGGPQRRLAAFAVVATTLAWLLGMTLAVVYERPLW